MAELIDREELSKEKSQWARLYEGGIVTIRDGERQVEIKLDAVASTKLYDFLLLHMDRLHRHAEVIRHNREMDERNRIIRENVEKPWLPLHDGE